MENHQILFLGTLIFLYFLLKGKKNETCKDIGHDKSLIFYGFLQYSSIPTKIYVCKRCKQIIKILDVNSENVRPTALNGHEIWGAFISSNNDMVNYRGDGKNLPKFIKEILCVNN